jgi:hypothetical protein
VEYYCKWPLGLLILLGSGGFRYRLVPGLDLFGVMAAMLKHRPDWVGRVRSGGDGGATKYLQGQASANATLKRWELECLFMVEEW